MNILICGGGTGGHLYPGIELAKNYQKQGHNVFYIATKNGIDKKIIDNLDIDEIQIEYWNLNGIKRTLTIKNILKNIITIFKVLFLMIKSFIYLKKNKVDIVIGVGGYITYPIVKTATILKIYTAIHEQNSYPGLVNRKLASQVDKVLITYETSKRYFSNVKSIQNVSNPRVNRTLDLIGKDFSKVLGLDEKQKKILFLGGSLGSEVINNLFFEFINQKKNKYQAILIGGLRQKNYKNNIKMSNHIILEHTNEILKYIATADIIISRGGATTLLEIIYLEKKSIIIPSPNVVADHQTKNALEFKEQNLLEILDETKANINSLNKVIEKELVDNTKERYFKKYKKIDSLECFNNILKEVKNG